jgi:hypothetical protein
MTLALALILKPLGVLLLFGSAIPFRILAQRFLKDGKLKRFLLFKIHDRF